MRQEGRRVGWLLTPAPQTTPASLGSLSAQVHPGYQADEGGLVFLEAGASLKCLPLSLCFSVSLPPLSLYSFNISLCLHSAVIKGLRHHCPGWPQLLMLLKMTLNSRSSSVHLPNAGVAGFQNPTLIPLSPQAPRLYHGPPSYLQGTNSSNGDGWPMVCLQSQLPRRLRQEDL